MTPEQEALREKVARALCAAADDDWDRSFFSMVASNDTPKTGQEAYRALADAVIAVVLKEAARVAKGYPDTYNDPVSAHAELMTCVRIGNAILSLIPQS